MEIYLPVDLVSIAEQVAAGGALVFIACAVVVIGFAFAYRLCSRLLGFGGGRATSERPFHLMSEAEKRAEDRRWYAEVGYTGAELDEQVEFAAKTRKLQAFEDEVRSRMPRLAPGESADASKDDRLIRRYAKSLGL